MNDKKLTPVIDLFSKPKLEVVKFLWGAAVRNTETNQWIRAHFPDEQELNLVEWNVELNDIGIDIDSCFGNHTNKNIANNKNDMLPNEEHNYIVMLDNKPLSCCNSIDDAIKVIEERIFYIYNKAQKRIRTIIHKNLRMYIEYNYDEDYIIQSKPTTPEIYQIIPLSEKAIIKEKFLYLAIRNFPDFKEDIFGDEANPALSSPHEFDGPSTGIYITETVYSNADFCLTINVCCQLFDTPIAFNIAKDTNTKDMVAFLKKVKNDINRLWEKAIKQEKINDSWEVLHLLHKEKEKPDWLGGIETEDEFWEHS